MRSNHGMRCKCGQRWSVRAWPDKGYEKWRAAAAPFFRRRAPRVPLEGPLELQLVVVMPFLEGDRRKTRHVPRRWHEARPDWDNVGKAICDAAQDHGWLKNDWLVARVVLEKVYAAQGEEPSVSIVLRPLPPYGR